MSQTTRKKTIELLLIITTWALGILLAYWMLLKLTGHSPTLEQLNTGLLLLVLTLILKQQTIL